MRFQPTLPARGATIPLSTASQVQSAFQPTLPARGATGIDCAFGGHNQISTHAPRTGSDSTTLRFCERTRTFQPTLPARGATRLTEISTRRFCISTHAPRTGSDALSETGRYQAGDFNPRSPHGERLAVFMRFPPQNSHFNPRSPHGERPGIRSMVIFAASHFNPRSPHGERPQQQHGSPDCIPISTHAPRTGSDTRRARLSRLQKFQPTLPARGATASGEILGAKSRFQPTLPARGATGLLSLRRWRVLISTHAPRTGSDRLTSSAWLRKRTFQPTLPARGATPTKGAAKESVAISTHAPRTGSDCQEGGAK